MIMLRTFIIAAALSIAASSSASAQHLFNWLGGGYVRHNENCVGLPFDTNATMQFRYRPANLADNAPNAAISMFNKHQAFSFSAPGPFFSSTLQTVQATTISSGGVNYTAKMKLTKLSPLNVTVKTPTITVAGRIVGFSGLIGNANCLIDFEFIALRCEYIDGANFCDVH